jgi:hypothetical protein
MVVVLVVLSSCNGSSGRCGSSCNGSDVGCTE